MERVWESPEELSSGRVKCAGPESREKSPVQGKNLADRPPSADIFDLCRGYAMICVRDDLRLTLLQQSTFRGDTAMSVHRSEKPNTPTNLNPTGPVLFQHRRLLLVISGSSNYSDPSTLRNFR